MDIYVSVLDIEGLEPEQERWQQYISPTRKKKLEKTRHPDMRCQSVGVELALLQAVAMVKPGFKGPDEYRYTADGAPIRPDGWWMSLTHTRGVCAAALCRTPVGIDLERPREFPEILVRRLLDDEEFAEYSAAENKTACFLKFWTRREAAFKLGGDSPLFQTLTLPCGGILSVASEQQPNIILSVNSWQNINL